MTAPLLYIKMTDYQELYFLYSARPHSGIVVNECTRVLKSFYGWAGEGACMEGENGGPRALLRVTKPFHVCFSVCLSPVYHLSIVHHLSIYRSVRRFSMRYWLTCSWRLGASTVCHLQAGDQESWRWEPQPKGRTRMSSVGSRQRGRVLLPSAFLICLGP